MRAFSHHCMDAVMPYHRYMALSYPCCHSKVYGSQQWLLQTAFTMNCAAVYAVDNVSAAAGSSVRGQWLSCAVFCCCWQPLQQGHCYLQNWCLVVSAVASPSAHSCCCCCQYHLCLRVHPGCCSMPCCPLPQLCYMCLALPYG